MSSQSIQGNISQQDSSPKTPTDKTQEQQQPPVVVYKGQPDRILQLMATNPDFTQIMADLHAATMKTLHYSPLNLLVGKDTEGK